jgi:hypothetical protein
MDVDRRVYNSSGGYEYTTTEIGAIDAFGADYANPNPGGASSPPPNTGSGSGPVLPPSSGPLTPGSPVLPASLSSIVSWAESNPILAVGAAIGVVILLKGVL